MNSKIVSLKITMSLLLLGAPLILKTPASTYVLPAYVFCPERFKVPEPSFLKFDEALTPEIEPLNVALDAD